MKLVAVMILWLTGPLGLLGSPTSSNSVKMSLDLVSEMFSMCEDCKVMLAGVQALHNALSTHLDAESIFSSSCATLVPLFGHNSTTICPDLMKQYLPDVQNVLIQDILQDACEIFEFCPRKALGEEDAQWLAPSTPPLPEQQLESLGDIWTTSQQKEWKHRSEPVTFVQISDIHLDRAYTKNAATKCGHSICCRSNITGEGSAGVFGSYNCDASQTTVTAMLDFIQNLNPRPDFFVYVGDNSPHVVDDTHEDKFADNMLVYTLLVDKLRHIGPIYPVLGNHEAYPTSVYSRPMARTQSLLESLSQHWPSMFKVTPDQLSNIRKHAFYTTLVMPGLRILTTNCLYEFLYNIYALKSNLDPVKKEQQQFVRQTLQDARANKEKVIYVSHMKPSPLQTYPSYADELTQLSKDFSDVIILQLFGHEHWDVFLLNRDPENQDKITGVSLAAPSITTYASSNVGVNPSFRLYQLDPATFQALDYTQYYINITEANEKGVAEVKKHYTFTQAYNVPDMSPSSFGVISNRIHSNWTDYRTFEANYYVLADDRPVCSLSDLLCRRKLTCQTRESKPLGYAACVLGH